MMPDIPERPPLVNPDEKPGQSLAYTCPDCKCRIVGNGGHLCPAGGDRARLNRGPQSLAQSRLGAF